MNRIRFGAKMVDSYNSGNTVRQVAKEFGISTGLMFKLLRDNGCVFRRSGWHISPEALARRKTPCGVKMTDAIRAKLSEAKKCHFNGLNGYGHTKNHCKGYVLGYAPEHPNAHADGYVMLHTIVVERHIGRYLRDDEVVHHINHIRNDNRIENLQLMEKTEHRRMHMVERHEKKRGVALSTL